MFCDCYDSITFQINPESELLKSDDSNKKKVVPIIAITSIITPAIDVWNASMDQYFPSALQ